MSCINLLCYDSQIIKVKVLIIIQLLNIQILAKCRLRHINLGKQLIAAISLDQSIAYVTRQDVNWIVVYLSDEITRENP
jgi:hypothetical protein